MKWIPCLVLLSLGYLLTGCGSMPKLPNDAKYGINYRFQTDTDRGILDGGFMPEILLSTNDWHGVVRTPNFTRTVSSEKIEDARDSWRANGIEFGYGRPLWQTDPGSLIGSTRLDWEVNGGFLIGTERKATETFRIVETVRGPQEIRERGDPSTSLLPTVGAGFSFRTGVNTPGGGSYSSVGLQVNGGYRVAGDLGTTPYIDVGLVLGL